MTPPLAEPDRLPRLIRALSTPEAYPHPVGPIEVRQTHISCVFLAGDFAYKLKKPIDFGFLDYSRLEARVHFAEEELRINRRLAPSVYLGLEWVRERDGRLGFFADGSPFEVAVKMRRLPDDATFLARLRRGVLSASDLGELAELLVAFYGRAERGPSAVTNASLAMVAANARENFTQLEPFRGAWLPDAELDELRRLTERGLDALGPLIEARARSHACETHGDLRLEHVYRLGEAPSDLVVIDAVEFSDRLRFADPAADLAFLVMELEREGAAALAQGFLERYVESSKDAELLPLIPFYVAYRALVRAKIECFKTEASELPATERQEAPGRVRSHLDLARRSLLRFGAHA